MRPSPGQVAGSGFGLAVSSPVKDPAPKCGRALLHLGGLAGSQALRRACAQTALADLHPPPNPKLSEARVCAGSRVFP